jgi:hypothetical protein
LDNLFVDLEPDTDARLFRIMRQAIKRSSPPDIGVPASMSPAYSKGEKPGDLPVELPT